MCVNSYWMRYLNKGKVIFLDSTAIMLADGTAIYTSDIDQLVDEYQMSLPKDRTLQEVETFSGLISFLYQTLFAPRKQQHQNSSLDYDDVDSLDIVWQKYVSLCGRYKQTPSLFEYCTLTGISPDTLTDWGYGRIRGNDDKRIRTIKRWKNQCVSALEKKAISGSIGAIFSLKAAHGWRESLPVSIETEQRPEIDSPEQIMARHRHASLTMPEKPDLGD